MTDGPRVLSSRTVYENPWTALREDRLLWPDGREDVFGIVDKAPFAVVVARHADGRIELVEQWRAPIRRRSWELPMGALPEGREGTAEQIARAELMEETGLRAGRMTVLGELDAAPGLCSHGLTAFLATDLTREAQRLERTEADLTARSATPEELGAMIAGGRLRDAISMAVLGLASMRGVLPLSVPGS